MSDNERDKEIYGGKEEAGGGRGRRDRSRMKSDGQQSFGNNQREANASDIPWN